MLFLDTTETRVRMLRRGLTAQAIAQHMGVSQPTVSRWITGERPLPPARRADFLKHLGPARGLFRRANPSGGVR